MERYEIQQAIEQTGSLEEAANLLNISRYFLWKYAKEYSITIKLNQMGKGIPKKKTDGLGKIPLSEILEGLHPTYQTKNLKRRLIEEGIKDDKCEKCGIKEWQGRQLNLPLHHIDGNSTNHKLENLEILCPNCHSLTPNFAGRNSQLKNKIT